MPIAFAFGAATLSYLALATSVPLSIVAGQMQDGMTNLILLTVPLFVLLGLLMESVGIARRLVVAIAAFVGHLRGGIEPRAGSRHVSGLRDFRLQNGGHGRDHTGPVSGDGAARLSAQRDDFAIVDLGRDGPS